MSEPSAQGEIWTVRTITGQEYSAVIVDSNLLAQTRPVVMAARVAHPRETPAAMGLLTVPLNADQVVAVYSMAGVPRTAFAESEGRITDDQLEQLKVALGARFDL